MLFDSVSDNGDTVSMLSQILSTVSSFWNTVTWVKCIFLFIFKSAPCDCGEEMSA